MNAIFTNSLMSYFTSFVKMIALALLVTIVNIFMWVLPSTSILDYGYADLTMLFITLPYILIFFVPSMTMDSVVSDFQMGTSELLFSKPLSISSYWWAHFLSGAFIVAIFVLLTCSSYYSIVMLKSESGIIDHGQIFASFLGIFLLALVFISLSLFCSSFSKTPTAGFLTSIILCYVIYVLPGYLSEVGIFAGHIDYFLKYLSLDTHFYTLGKGMLEVKSVIYFGSIVALVSMLGIRNIMNRLR